MIRVKESLDPGKLLNSFINGNPTVGGIISFCGQIRPKSNREDVISLFLQSYEPLTSHNICQTIKEAKERWALEDARVIHRVGNILIGETIVFVATASKHRRDAFEAADFLMDYLKTEAFFWKKEVTKNGASWVEPRDSDFLDAQRWSEQLK